MAKSRILYEEGSRTVNTLLSFTFSVYRVWLTDKLL